MRVFFRLTLVSLIAFSIINPHPARSADAQTLTEEDAKHLIRTVMDEAYAASAPLNKDMAALYDARYAALTADTFDASAYTDISDKLDSLHDKKHAIRNAAVIRLAQRLHTPELRSLLARYIDKRRGKPKKR